MLSDRVSSNESSCSSNINKLPTEDEIEEEANSHQYLMKHFRVAKCEYKRFLMFAIMFFIIGFIYSFMRIIKDTYVMVRQEPICIAYLKVFYITPISFGVILLVNYALSARTVSRIFTLSCLVFAFLFLAYSAVVIFEEKIVFSPLHIKAQIELSKLETRGLGFLSNFLLTVNEPFATLIYITAEMWGSLILSYLFLSFLNETCTRKQHSRFLPPLFIVANISLLISALVTTVFFKIRAKISFEQNRLMMSIVFLLEGLLTLVVVFAKYILERKIMTRPIFCTPIETHKQNNTENNLRESANNTRSNNSRNTNNPSKTKSKGSNKIGFMEGLKIMWQSRFVLAMSAIVFFFSALFNILETVHKNGIKQGAEFYNIEKGRYSGMFNNLEQYITAVAVIILNLSPFSSLIDTHGWKLVAMITPVMAGISVFVVLGLSIYNSASIGQSFSLLNKILEGNKPFIYFENFASMICLASMKIFKFTAFDISKEKISMRIEDKYRPKFKSVFDGIFNKVGKSIGAVYGIALTLIVTDLNIRSMSPLTIFFTVPAILLWIIAVLYLTNSYNTSIENNQNVDIDLITSEDEEFPDKSIDKNLKNEKVMLK